MLKQGSDFLFEISNYRDNRSRDNEGRLYVVLHAKHYKHNGDGRSAPGVRRNGSVPTVLSVYYESIAYCLMEFLLKYLFLNT